MSVFTKAQLSGDARTLAQAYYMSSDVFRQETERIFARRWVCIGRTEQVQDAGDYFLADVCGESLMVVRDAAGDVHALYNVCRHRGARMVVEERGTLHGSIQCPYHAWTYGLDGTLMTARNMQGIEGFDKADYPLCSVAIAQWEGFLFVNLAPEPEPFERSFALLLGRFARWHIGELRMARTIRYDLACNWKLLFQNYSECYHCPVIHPALDRLTPSDSGRNDLSEGPFLGGYMTLRQPGGGMSMSGTRQRRPLGEIAGEEIDRAYFYTIFPSLFLSLHADYVMAHVVKALAVDRSEVTCSWLFDPIEVAASDFDPSDVVEFWDMTNRQDWRICELAQLGIASRAYLPGPYAHQEGLLHAFDRHYLSCIG